MQTYTLHLGGVDIIADADTWHAAGWQTCYGRTPEPTAPGAATALLAAIGEGKQGEDALARAAGILAAQSSARIEATGRLHAAAEDRKAAEIRLHAARVERQTAEIRERSGK